MNMVLVMHVIFLLFIATVYYFAKRTILNKDVMCLLKDFKGGVD